MGGTYSSKDEVCLQKTNIQGIDRAARRLLISCFFYRLHMPVLSASTQLNSTQLNHHKALKCSDRAEHLITKPKTISISEHRERCLIATSSTTMIE